ncbi:hypothetical protein A0H76_277 [Hepatospora eriocheir]|uniref:Uncharacterized protein n=1 Tax=Hepatospora eriocheir TaxID=1081669 RepID=A0A1X0QJ07_9MICR|nr:hypothetical protein A0H76_277 [Hepatospora eriocheir]
MKKQIKEKLKFEGITFHVFFYLLRIFIVYLDAIISYKRSFKLKTIEKFCIFHQLLSNTVYTSIIFFSLLSEEVSTYRAFYSYAILFVHIIFTKCLEIKNRSIDSTSVYIGFQIIYILTFFIEYIGIIIISKKISYLLSDRYLKISSDKNIIDAYIIRKKIINQKIMLIRMGFVLLSKFLFNYCLIDYNDPKEAIDYSVDGKKVYGILCYLIYFNLSVNVLLLSYRINEEYVIQRYIIMFCLFLGIFKVIFILKIVTGENSIFDFKSYLDIFTTSDSKYLLLLVILIRTLYFVVQDFLKLESGLKDSLFFSKKRNRKLTRKLV